MLTDKELKEIREHLDNAQNPLFLFDNDIDGLMSFILLRRKINRGKGVAIKSFPELDSNYINRVDEFNSDCIFILDKPLVSKEFFEETRKRNIPVVWIDHHDVGSKIEEENVFYYNPVFSKKGSNEPVSCIAYKVVNNKEDIWLAMAGCLSDNFLPEFKDDFIKKYPDIWKKNAQSAFEVLYESEFGKLITILDFSLKDRTSNVVYMINFLFDAKNPSDILVENEKNVRIFKRYEEVNKIYQKLLDNAKSIARSSNKLIVFKYSGDLSLSADLANELSYRFPGKVIAVIYLKDATATLSIRGREDIRKITIKAISKIPNATGGGHKNATGAKMFVDDLGRFLEIFEEELD